MPQLLTAEELNRFFKAVRDGGQVQHEIMLKLLLFTAVRALLETSRSVGRSRSA
ncbi:hypothetical protein BOO71_0004267 [Deinococcus marmoris]|uniref:Mobile element protein n=1 Tax=Deinococcus marmoris TaxID=249408 RepID=A0A1U7P1B3_9DEIO|nr:hypothetical protein BOO71_0004267 [Deinococcus marmoris]